MCETFCERVAWWRNVKPRENLSSRLSSVGVFFDEYPSCSLENVIARHAPGDRRSVQGERMLLTPVGNRLAGLQCNWTMVVAVFTVGTTILLVDYLFFRDSDLEELTGPAILCRNAPTSSVNRHAEKMNAAGAGGYRGKPTDTGRRRKRLGRACLLTAWIGCLIVCDRSHRKSLVRLSLLLGAFVASLPHLVRPSKYRRDRTLGCVLEEGDMRRSVTDKLVWTSLIYIVPAVYGVVVHQYGLAFLQLMTTIGSTSYHLARETKFFNLDNVFATSLLCTILWGLFLSVWHGIWWFTLAVVVGGPLAVFCIVRCGMPGLVCPHPCGHGLCRKSNPEYDFLHMVWHVVSGFGTMVSIYFFEVHFPAKDAGGGRFHWLLDMPVVPTVSLALGVALNVYANIVGLMPLD